MALRAFYFDELGMVVCFSFENQKRKFFDIDPRSKIDVVVAGTGGQHRTLVELTSQRDLGVLTTAAHDATCIGDLRKQLGLDIRQEINIARGAAAFIRRQEAIGDQDPREWTVLEGMLRQRIVKTSLQTTAAGS